MLKTNLPDIFQMKRRFSFHYLLKMFFSVEFIFNCHPTTAQEKLSLQQAIEIGLQNNFSILIAKNESDIAHHNVSFGNAGALPEINANLIQNKSVNNTKQKYASGAEVNKTGATANSLNATAALSWTVFDGFKMFAVYNRLKSMKQYADLNMRQQVENIVSDIIAGYFDVIRQEALLNVIASSMNISDVKLNIAKTKFEIGTTSKVEYLQAQVDKNAEASAYKKQTINIQSAKVNVNKLLARDLSLDFEVSDSIEINYQPQYEQLKAAFEKQNSSMLIARENIKIYHYYVDEWRAQHFPSLDLNAGYNYSQSHSQANFILDNRTNGLNYGFTARWNLFNGFNLNRSIKNARLDYENSKLNFESVKKNIDAEMIVAFKTFQNNLDLLKLEEDNSRLAKENVDLSLARYQSGIINELQLKEAQQSFKEALNRLVLARYDAKVTETNLKKLAGDLLK